MRASAIEDSPASTAIPLLRSKSQSSSVPGSAKFTEQNSGRTVQLLINAWRRALSPTIHNPVVNPIGNPGHWS